MSTAVAVFGIALLAALLYAVLEKQAPAYALLLSLGAALVLLVRAGTSIRTVLSGIARLAGQADSGAFSCLVRSAAIVLLTDYTRTLCEEAGAESLGWCVGLAGRCLVLGSGVALAGRDPADDWEHCKMKNWKWLAFLLVGTSLCLCAPTVFAAESAGLHTQLPGSRTLAALS